MKETKIGKVGKTTDNKLRIVNDSDAAFLMYYYYHLQQQQSKFWNGIVNMVDELRNEEIIEGLGCETADVKEYQFRDIRTVVLDAHILVNEQRIEDSLQDKNKPSPEQMRIVEELLNRHGKTLS